MARATRRKPAIRSGHVVAGRPELVCGLVAQRVDARHDLGETLLGVLEGPRVPAGVLLHLESRRRHPARVRRLPRAERDPGLQERPEALGCGGHVRTLRDGATPVAQQHPRITPGELVLRRARQRDVAGDLPDVAPWHERRVGTPFGVVTDASAFHLLDLRQELQVDPLGSWTIPSESEHATTVPPSS